MFRRTGITSSILAALVIALVPALPARADVAPAAAIEDPAAIAAPSEEALTIALERAGMRPDEAQSLVARLDARERGFVAARVEGAQAGGLVFLVPLIPFLIGAAIFLGFIGTAAAVQEAQENAKPEGSEADPANGPASDAAKGRTRIISSRSPAKAISTERAADERLQTRR